MSIKVARIIIPDRLQSFTTKSLNIEQSEEINHIIMEANKKVARNNESCSNIDGNKTKPEETGIIHEKTWSSKHENPGKAESSGTNICNKLATNKTINGSGIEHIKLVSNSNHDGNRTEMRPKIVLKIFKTKQGDYKVKINQKERDYNCPTPPKMFGLSVQLEDHIEEKPNKTIQCKRCPETFIAQKLFRQHFKTIHRPKLGAVPCTFCQGKYSNERCLKVHLKNCHPEYYQARAYSEKNTQQAQVDLKAAEIPICETSNPKNVNEESREINEHKQVSKKLKQIHSQDFSTEIECTVEYVKNNNYKRQTLIEKLIIPTEKENDNDTAQLYREGKLQVTDHLKINKSFIKDLIDKQEDFISVQLLNSINEKTNQEINETFLANKVRSNHMEHNYPLQKTNEHSITCHELESQETQTSETSDKFESLRSYGTEESLPDISVNSFLSKTYNKDRSKVRVTRWDGFESSHEFEVSFDVEKKPNICLNSTTLLEHTEPEVLDLDISVIKNVEIPTNKHCDETLHNVISTALSMEKSFINKRKILKNTATISNTEASKNPEKTYEESTMINDDMSINHVFEAMEDILTVEALDGFLTDSWHWK